MSSASAEYPPHNLVILGSHIRQNSFDTWAAAAAKTSAAIVATSWAVPRLVSEISLTSKVQFNSAWFTLWNGIEEWGGKCGGGDIGASESTSSDSR